MIKAMRFNMIPAGQPNPSANGLYVRHEDYARLEQECERLRDLLRSAQWCMQVDPSCQSGVIEKCGCRKCVHSRADAALSAKP